VVEIVQFDKTFHDLRRSQEQDPRIALASLTPRTQRLSFAVPDNDITGDISADYAVSQFATSRENKPGSRAMFHELGHFLGQNVPQHQQAVAEPERYSYQSPRQAMASAAAFEMGRFDRLVNSKILTDPEDTGLFKKFKSGATLRPDEFSGLTQKIMEVSSALGDNPTPDLVRGVGIRTEGLVRDISGNLKPIIRPVHFGETSMDRLDKDGISKRLESLSSASRAAMIQPLVENIIKAWQTPAKKKDVEPNWNGAAEVALGFTAEVGKKTQQSIEKSYSVAAEILSEKLGKPITPVELMDVVSKQATGATPDNPELLKANIFRHLVGTGEAQPLHEIADWNQQPPRFVDLSDLNTKTKGQRGIHIVDPDGSPSVEGVDIQVRGLAKTVINTPRGSVWGRKAPMQVWASDSEVSNTYTEALSPESLPSLKDSKSIFLSVNPEMLGASKAITGQLARAGITATNVTSTSLFQAKRLVEGAAQANNRVGVILDFKTARDVRRAWQVLDASAEDILGSYEKAAYVNFDGEAPEGSIAYRETHEKTPAGTYKVSFEKAGPLRDNQVKVFLDKEIETVDKPDFSVTKTDGKVWINALAEYQGKIPPQSSLFEKKNTLWMTPTPTGVVISEESGAFKISDRSETLQVYVPVDLENKVDASTANAIAVTLQQLGVKKAIKFRGASNE